MTITKKKLTYFNRVTILLFLAATIIISCDKDDNPQTTPVKTSGLAVIHGSPGSPEYVFQVNNIKFNQKPLTYSTAIPYTDINNGKYELSITKKDDSITISKSTVELISTNSYSVYIANVPAKVSLVVVQDNLLTPAANKAKIRFGNLSPDAGDLNVKISGSSANLFSSTKFKDFTSFAQIDPADELTFEISENGKTEVLATLPKVKIEKGRIYTLWSKGIKAISADSTKLALGVITNK